MKSSEAMILAVVNANFGTGIASLFISKNGTRKIVCFRKEKRVRRECRRTGCFPETYYSRYPLSYLFLLSLRSFLPHFSGARNIKNEGLSLVLDPTETLPHNSLGKMLVYVYVKLA